MDTELRERLTRIEKQIEAVYQAEEAYLTLDAARDHTRAVLMSKAEGTSQAAREMAALATPEWAEFSKALAIAEAMFHRERHTLELKQKAYDASHLSYKIENSVITKSF